MNVILLQLFTMINDKLRPQNKETILSLQYRRLNRENEESVQQWMGRL